MDRTRIAGGPGDFLAAEHVVLRAAPVEVGRALTELSREALGIQSRPPAACAAIVNRTKKRYYREHWPEHWARMQGAADALGLSLDDDACDVSSLLYPSEFRLGCSNVYYPKAALDGGGPRFSRNMDFYTLRLGSEPDAPAVFGRPFLLDVRPPGGMAYLCMTALDLLGGASDGINEAGLCVAYAGNGEASAAGLSEPSAYGVGIAEEEVVRFLLERATTADEALELLLRHRTYFRQTPLQFLVGDAHGNGFTFRYSLLRNAPEIRFAADRPLAITNHGLHAPAPYPPDVRQHPLLTDSVERLACLEQAFEQGGARDFEWVRGNAERVAQTGPPSPTLGGLTNRTIWHAFYDLADRSVSLNFYLGDGDRPGEVRRSDDYVARIPKRR